MCLWGQLGNLGEPIVSLEKAGERGTRRQEGPWRWRGCSHAPVSRRSGGQATGHKEGELTRYRGTSDKAKEPEMGDWQS
jgi:hypothetical protein